MVPFSFQSPQILGAVPATRRSKLDKPLRVNGFRCAAMLAFPHRCLPVSDAADGQTRIAGSSARRDHAERASGKHGITAGSGLELIPARPPK